MSTDNLNLADRGSLVASLPHGGVAAEIGVCDGTFSDIILANNSPCNLYLIDPWAEQSVEVTGHDPANVAQSVHDGRFAAVCAKYQTDARVKVVRRFSQEASTMFCTGEFDWVYLDGNHLQVQQDIDAWWPKIKHGGYLLGHDYTVAGDFIYVKPVVDAWVAKEGLPLAVAGLNSSDIYEHNYPTWIVQKP